MSLIFINIQGYRVHAEIALLCTNNQTEDIFIEVISCSESVILTLLWKYAFKTTKSVWLILKNQQLLCSLFFDEKNFRIIGKLAGKRA